MGKTSKSSPLLLDHVTIDSLNLPQPSCSPHPGGLPLGSQGPHKWTHRCSKSFRKRFFGSLASEIPFAQFTGVNLANIDNYQLTILVQFGCAFSNWISLISWKNSNQSGLTPMNSDIPHVSSHDLGAGWLLKPSSKSSIASQQTNTRKLQHVSNFAHGKVNTRGWNGKLLRWRNIMNW